MNRFKNPGVKSTNSSGLSSALFIILGFVVVIALILI